MALMWYLLVCLVVLGAVVGSFLNVCIYRLPWEKSIIWPGSHCPKCLHAVRPYDNIPILSWFILRGRCRDCGAGFSPRYMLLEALTALLFGCVFFVEVIWFGNPIGQCAFHLVLVAALVVATFIDFDLLIIPDSVTIPTTLFGLIGAALIPSAHIQLIVNPASDPLPTALGDAAWDAAVIATGWFLWLLGLVWLVRRRETRLGAAEILIMTVSSIYLAGQTVIWGIAVSGAAPAWPGWQVWWIAHPRLLAVTTSIVGMLVGAGLIWVVRVAGTAILKKEAMGFGDVTLLMMVGAFLGWQPVVLIFFMAPFMGLIMGIVQWLARGEHVLPYGPYLALASLVTLLSWPVLWWWVQIQFAVLAIIPVHWAVAIAVPLLLWCFWRADHVERQAASEQR